MIPWSLPLGRVGTPEVTKEQLSATAENGHWARLTTDLEVGAGHRPIIFMRDISDWDVTHIK